MSRLFDDGSSEYLQRAGAVVSSLPFAFICRFLVDDLTVNHSLVQVVNSSTVADDHSLYIDAANDKVNAASRNTGVSEDVASTSTSISVDTWHFACGIWAAADDRRALLDAGGKGTNATSVSPSGLDRTSIGRAGDSTPGAYLSGKIAEVAIYDLSDWPGATASDKADSFESVLSGLSDGFVPECYPLGLIAYYDLVRGLTDKFGGYDLTASGTVVAAHPRVIKPCGVI